MCVTHFTIEEKLNPTESAAVLEKAVQQEKESVNIFQNRKILYTGEPYQQFQVRRFDL